MGVWSRLAGEVFVPWLAADPGLRWLDVGCGNGAFTELIVNRCRPAAVLGIDPSEAQLVFARQRPAGRVAEFRLGDAMALPVADAGFDAAVMALVIFFVPDPDKALAEMARAVKPGGQVSAYAWDLPGGGFPLEPITAELRAAGIQPAMPPSAAVSRMEALTALWKGRLEDVQSREIAVERVFPSFDEYWRVAKLSPSNGPKLKALSEAEAAALRERVRVRVKPGPDGAIRATARANAVKGRVHK
jgi:ubiquinone/menaquinone biosynthesis C-methylase UbiE